MGEARDVETAAFRANALEIVGSWSVHDDDDGHLFYYNLESGESRWHVPDELRALESAFMMKLMLDGALARSGAWTVHDTGDGTLYYFNEKTRESVWERPQEWGAETVVAGNGQTAVPPPPPPPGQTKKPTPPAEKEARGDKEESKPKKKKKERPVAKEEEAPKAPPTAEEVEILRKRAEEAQKSRENFRDMLRDKKIMPFCKWSVAFPQIATDPRFLAIETMDERREIFEDFVKNRPSDLKSEKKQKLKDAKKKLSKLLREQFKRQRERGTFDEKLTLVVFLTTLEDHISADQHQKLKQDVLAFLPLAVQEKLWQKEMNDFLEATKGERVQEAELKAFLLEKFGNRGQYVSWHDSEVQDALKTFASRTMNPLPPIILQAVVEQVARASSQKAISISERKVAPQTPSPLQARSHQRESMAQPSSRKASARGSIGAYRQSLNPRHPSRSHSRERDESRGRSNSRRRRRSLSRSRSSSRSRSRAQGRRHDRDDSRSRRYSHGDSSRRTRRSRSSSGSRSSSRSSSRDRSRRRR